MTCNWPQHPNLCYKDPVYRGDRGFANTSPQNGSAILLALLIVMVFCVDLHGQIAKTTSSSAKTRVIVLGVNHSDQLVSPLNQPGLLTAFIEKLHPSAICVERPPELAARGDFYEFTYEVQGIVLPYAAAHPVDICPIDWMPPVEDQKMAFGGDLDVPPEVRPQSSFLTFPDPSSINEGFFAGEDPKMIDPVKKRMSQPNSRADRDFPRRLYLYRTFMQSQHIRAAARAHSGQTLLVVVGYFHKPDLESILANDPEIEIVQPSLIGAPTQQEAETRTTQVQFAAILAFNLLGRQAESGNVDWGWIEHVLGLFEKKESSPEAALFRIRFEELTQHIASAEAEAKYATLVESVPAGLRFTWTGVKDEGRLDSYFDPFGNLTVRQRALLELARIQNLLNSHPEAARNIARIRGELSPRQARQLDAYTREYGVAQPTQE